MFNQANSPSTSSIGFEELYRLCAADGVLYAHSFFPKAFRDESPSFHRRIWRGLEAPGVRFFAAECFRGSAKTTLARTCVSKRVAYALSHTILAVSSSQAHAIRSVRWLKRQVEINSKWTNFFGLEKGGKWKDDEIEIYNRPADQLITMLALGITGQTRGLNIDDRRPDFIMVDDPCDDENTATEEQRKKTERLFFGALQPSLAPASEAPHAKMALLQTGLDKDDLIHLTHRDPRWVTEKHSIFAYQEETGRPIASTWPERFPFEEMIKEKEAFIHRQQLHLWLREYECKIISPELSIFNIDFVKYYDQMPESGLVYCGIDPASSEEKTAHASAICFWKVTPGGAAYLLDYFVAKGKNPEELWNVYLQLAMKYRPHMTGIESISYQRTLAWFFRQKMIQTNCHFAIREIQDRRRKADRITQAHSGRLYNGQLFVRREHTEFIELLSEYTGKKDIDLLDASAMALDLAVPMMLTADAIEGETIPDDEWIEPLEVMGGAP